MQNALVHVAPAPRDPSNRSKRSEPRRAELETWLQSHHETDSKTIRTQANQPPEHLQTNITAQAQTVQNMDRSKMYREEGIILR